MLFVKAYYALEEAFCKSLPRANALRRGTAHAVLYAALSGFY